MEDEGPQIRVKFVTKNASVRVTETPFAVPLRLNRQGLSQVVNHLLAGSAGHAPRPFDFLVDGKFLRSSLEKYAQANGVSEEALLTLEYVEALPAPEQTRGASHPDWVSAVASSGKWVVTGCYDGVLRVHNTSESSGKRADEAVASIKAHHGAVKAVSFVQAASALEFFVATSGKDQLAQIWRFDAREKALTPVAALTGHLNSVDAVAIAKGTFQGQRIAATGSWDNTVRVWNLPTASKTTDDDDAQPTKKQKRAGGASSGSFQQLEAEMVLVGHTSNVTGVAFAGDDSVTQLVSASSDRTVRIWDVATQSCAQTLAGTRAVSGVSVNTDGLVLTAHPDQCVRLWDPRAAKAGERIVQQTFQSHAQWVSAVAWHPTNANLFLSGGYDGQVKVWDARSSVPLHSLAAHDGKTLDVAWRDVQEAAAGDEDAKRAVAFASGGDDKQLKLFSV